MPRTLTRRVAAVVWAIYARDMSTTPDAIAQSTQASVLARALDHVIPTNQPDSLDLAVAELPPATMYALFAAGQMWRRGPAALASWALYNEQALRTGAVLFRPPALLSWAHTAADARNALFVLRWAGDLSPEEEREIERYAIPLPERLSREIGLTG